MIMKQNGKAVSILLVEDDPDLAASLTRVLEEGGYRTKVSSDGGAALALVQQESFSLAMVDIKLPGDVDGYQLCQLLKNHQLWLPVMMLSAPDRVEDNTCERGMGADDYVSGPFNSAELLVRVRAALRLYETQQLLTKYSERLHSVTKIGQAVTSIVDLESFVWKAISLSLETFDLGYFGVGLLQNTDVLWEVGCYDDRGIVTKQSARTELTYPGKRDRDLTPTLGSTATALREAVRHFMSTQLPGFSPHISAPIIHGKTVLGVLFGGNREPLEISTEERFLFGALAEQLAVAVTNARLVMAERRESYVAEILLQVTRLLSNLQNLDEVCQAVVGAMRQISGVHHSAVGFWENEAGDFVLKNLFADSEDTRQLVVNLPVESQAELLEAIEKVNDSFILKRTRGKAGSLNEFLTQSDSAEILVMPVLREAQTRCVMLLYAKPWHQFSSHDHSLANGIAYQLAKSIENARYFSRLKEERAKLETVLLNMQNGVFIVDAKGQIAYCNPQLARFVRSDSQALLGHSYYALFHQVITHSGNSEKTRLEFEAALNQLSDQPSVEVILLDPNPLYIQFQFFAIDTGMSGRYGWGCVVRDVSDERERLAATSNLLSGISQELHSPLAAIKGFVSMLSGSQAYWDEKRRQAFLDNINESANRLGRLIEHMLEVLRLDAGIVHLDRRLISLEPIIQRTVQPIRFAQKDNEYEIVVQEDLPEIEIDPMRVEQMLRNLLEYASKQSPPGGKIVIRADQQDDEIVISVSDQGIGIPPESLPHIFERSYRIDPLSSDPGFDAGFGLYLCKETVVAHGGRIWAESEVGKGTIIYVALPMNPLLSKPMLTSSQSVAQPALAQRAAWAPINGLLVEDDAAMLRLLDLALQSEGYKTVAARRGETALELAATERFDFVLLDIQLPDLDGFQVCRRLREFTTVPVIMVTGRADDRDRVRGFNVGADDYLVKPINQDELIARVHAVLRRAQAPSKVEGQPIVHFGDLTLDFAHRQVLLRDKIVSLNPREYQLLYQLASKPGRVLTHSQLLAEIWGSEYRDETHYLWVHISRLRRKLEDDIDEPRYIFTEPGVGYRFAGSEPAS